jgi:Zn-dependent protease with chaperone function
MAQEKANAAISDHIFPRYAQTTTWIKKSSNAFHDTLDTAEKIIETVKSWALSFFQGVDQYFGNALTMTYHYFHPINPVTGERHLMLVSRSIEKILGDYLFYPLNTIFLMRTREKIPYTKEKMGSIVEKICQKILAANHTILNPPGEEDFQYQTEAMASYDFNAFAIPGGKVIVYSTLISQLAEALDGKDIKETLITLADGSRASVNLEGLTINDLLAALIGHEMAHVASRHSMNSISTSMARSIITEMFQGVIDTLFGKSEERRQAISTLFQDLQQLFTDASDLFLSRKHEFEADIAGAFFAKEAGYDPRGALYIQEFFRSSQSPIIQKIRERFELASTHPAGSRRLRALLAAIPIIDPKALEGRVSWKMAKEIPYDMDHASLALTSTQELKKILN